MGSFRYRPVLAVIVAVVAFGVRAFSNLGTVRQLVFKRRGWE